MALNPEQCQALLGDYLQAVFGPAYGLVRASRLSGGTVQDNWLLEGNLGDLRTRHVLRTGRAIGVNDSLPAACEFDVIRAAEAAGVRVAKPVACCADPSVIGAPFFVMDFVHGESRPWKVQRSPDTMDKGDLLLEELGTNLARLQTVMAADFVLPCLKAPPRNPALTGIEEMRAYLDSQDRPHPAIEYALRWLELNAPEPKPSVLCHGDFRLGNVMFNGRVEAVLDWELARWGDPHEDLAWFCMRFFRFARPELEGGGLGRRAALLRGWEQESGKTIDAGVMRYWDIMANTRWAVISIQQAGRHVSGQEKSLELALVGLGTAEMEFEALTLIRQEHSLGRGSVNG